MSLLAFSTNKKDILKLHGKSQADLDADLKIIKEWISQEAHLPQGLLEETAFIENTLIRNKYLLEKTKTKIENYCTLRQQHSYLFEDYVSVIQLSKEKACFHYLENLTEEYFRIAYYLPLDEANYDVNRDVGIALLQYELRTRYDYNNGEIMIFDYSDVSTEFITKMRVNVLINTVLIALKGHSAQVKAIHVINRWAGAFVAFFKLFLPGKLGKRVFPHENLESLEKVLPRKYFPKDYGGDQKSLEEIRADWDNIFKENFDTLSNACKLLTREDLRIASYNTELQGSFKRLSVD